MTSQAQITKVVFATNTWVEDTLSTKKNHEPFGELKSLIESGVSNMEEHTKPQVS